MKIRKAVIPAAGWGTRFLPATKALPKEMLPLVDKPLIQYIVEEAISSSIEQIIIITSSGKSAIEDHFDRDFELEYILEQKGERGLLEEVRGIEDLANICYIRQKEQLGLGHAILTAEGLIGREPFAVFLPDDIFDAKVPLLKQMIEVYQRYQGSVLALRRVTKKETRRYGIIKPKQMEERLYQVLDVVEKPAPDEAPSDLAILGRYILTPEIFEALETTPPGWGGEIQLSDGLALMLQKQAVYGYEFEGEYYDAGNPLGLLKATVALALSHPQIGADFKEYLRRLSTNL
ncbi:MAG: UTP--glucose-1-phosphate uridylyltransferase GalU [Dehalococcoidia bacterium]